MKRLTPVLLRSEAEAKWPGLQMRPKEPDHPPPWVKTDKPRRSGSLGHQLTCLVCAAHVEVLSAVSCPHCDEGPYHDGCHTEHICPKLPPTRVLGGDDMVEQEPEESEAVPQDPGRDTESSWQMVKSEEEKEESDNSDPEEPQRKLPKLYSGDNVEALMRAGLPRVKPGKEDEPEGKKDAWAAWDQDPSASQKSLVAHPAPSTPAPGTPFRRTEPLVKPYATGNRARAQEVAEDPEEFRKAMEEFQNDKFAASNQASHGARVQWWAHRAASLDVDPFPLTVTTIDMAGALLKAGQYRSAAQYFAALKREYILKSFPWGDDLNLAVRDAIRSCVRGIGADKQCPALDLRKLEHVREIEAVDGGPARTVDTVILFSLFACREMEAALRKVKHVQIDESSRGCGVVSVFLPASKTDSKGEGVLRKQGCICEAHPNLCPVAAAKRFLQSAMENGHMEEDPLIVTNQPKKTPTKQGMVKAFRRVAVALGLSEEEAQEITGHMLRPMGAQFMARKGVEFYKIQLFCRWGSDAVLKYLREVPLEGSEQWLAASLSIGEILTHSAKALEMPDGHPKATKMVRAIENALETQSTQVLQEANQTKQEIDKILEELRTKSLAMNEKWTEELSRKFLPKFLLNTHSKTLHAVKDAFTTGCGFEYRYSKDFKFTQEPPNPESEKFHMCEKAGCIKLFEAVAKAL